MAKQYTIQEITSMTDDQLKKLTPEEQSEFKRQSVLFVLGPDFPPKY